MKLSVKIFLGILIPSLISIFIISNLLINRYVDDTINLETEKAYQEFKNINNSIDGNSYSDSELKKILNDINPFLKRKNINLTYYRNDKKLYANNNLSIQDEKLLDASLDKYYSLIKKIDNNNILFISIKNGNDGVIIFNKNIDYIYESKNKLVTICFISSAILVLVILLIAYIISKTLTKPLYKITKEVEKISIGNYDINLSEGKNEVGTLAKSINIMSKEIKNRNDELVSMVENKQLFIDNLAHEMNTPLTSIYGYIELFEKANLDEEKRHKALTYMKTETKRIIDMQQKLLMLSYKEKKQIDKIELNLDKIFEQINIELSDKLKEKNITIKFINNIEKITGDELLISLALSNLIRNAINNSDSNTNILVTSYNKDRYCYISVKDKGYGISHEDITKILEPFYRVDKARSRKDGGAGLGLSIVKKIVDIHNGEILIESKIKEGSTFTLKIPV